MQLELYLHRVCANMWHTGTETCVLRQPAWDQKPGVPCDSSWMLLPPNVVISQVWTQGHLEDDD